MSRTAIRFSPSYRSMQMQIMRRYMVIIWASLVAQRLKRLPAMWETWVRSLGWEDPLEKEMATHSSMPSWRSPWTEKLGGLQSTGSQRVRHDWVTSISLFTFIWWSKSVTSKHYREFYFIIRDYSCSNPLNERSVRTIWVSSPSQDDHICLRQCR